MNFNLKWNWQLQMTSDLSEKFWFLLFEFQRKLRENKKEYSTKRQQAIGRFCLTFEFSTTLDFWKRDTNMPSPDLDSQCSQLYSSNETLTEHVSSSNENETSSNDGEQQKGDRNNNGRSTRRVRILIFFICSKWREGSNPKTLNWLFY